jgi:hypothetical protein
MPGSLTPRAAAVKDGPLGPPPEAARSVLEGGEHGVTLAMVGTAAIFARAPRDPPRAVYCLNTTNEERWN